MQDGWLAAAEAVLDTNSVRIAKAGGAITVDGRLDEGSWSDAALVTQFVETYPSDRGAAQVRTEARFLYDNKNLYIGIRAFDPHPNAIRTSLVRRDFVLADQDYLEILLDPQNTRRSAVLFRVNPSGVQTDGIFNEDTQTRDYAPDFNFDAATSHDASGWTAEFRIPLSTLHYQAGHGMTWAFVILRNWPRDMAVTIASAPIARGSTCVLCFASEVGGLVLPRTTDPLFISPQMTYSHLDGGEKVRMGVDAAWHPRPDTRIGVTLKPDFSQVEADDLQLTVNTRFALAVTEKRPFFLESSDLLSTPIAAVYTRAFTNPEAGARITRRGDGSEYTALILQDSGGGTILEPGSQSSAAGPEDFASEALVARYKRSGGSATWGVLGSGRWYADGSRNFVVGADANWSPAVTDRIGAQVLWSQTRDPDRPDLLAEWNGQHLSGGAGALTWNHTQENWFATLNYSAYSKQFRTWNGFVPQVGVSEPVLNTGLYFYPKSAWLIRVAPQIVYSEIDELGGRSLTRNIGPGISFSAARDTTLSVFWYPHAMDTTFAGSRSYNMYALSLLSTPFSWMPQASLSAVLGQGVDFSTGEVVDSQTWQASIPLRLFNHLELRATLAYQRLNSRAQNVPRTRLLTEENSQLSAIWYFSRQLYASASFQDSRWATVVERSASETTSRTHFSSFLLSYQANWQTRYYAGFRNGAQGREVFGKLSYAFSR